MIDVWSQIAQITDDWKPEYKEILHGTVVDVIREKDQLRVVVRPTATGPKADEIREFLLKAVAGPVGRILGGFKCQVRIFE